MPNRFKAVAVAAIVLGLAATHASAQVALAVTPVETGSGMISGMVLPSGVKAWYGIPYAKAPTQSLRWQPPQPVHWAGVWHADRKMPECIQVLRPHDINHYFGEEATSEDCLYMNIWAPEKATPGSKLPVVVFIHGGGFTIGSSGIPLYGGEPLAEKGVVFVNFNYRMGIFGFMAHPELTKEQGGHSGNYGLLDQLAALQWIHDNIARFGGDPDRVTLSGQSAGAMSVSAQLFSPLSKGLFQRAFLSSGCAWSGVMANAPSLAEAEATGEQIQNLLHAQNLEDMRAIPADRILAVQAEHQLGVHNPGARVGPIIDGYFTPGTMAQMMQAHQFNDVPILAESNGNDLDFSMGALQKTRTVAEYEAVVKQMYGQDAAAFLKLYPVHSDADVAAVARQAAQDNGLQGSARQCAEDQSGFAKSPFYISYFTRAHTYVPGVRIADLNPATAGAYHTSDIPFWFGTLDTFNLLRPTRAWTAADRAFSDRMMDSLVAFARTGHPSTPYITWPAWTASHEQRVEFGQDVRVEKIDTGKMDWLASHPPAPVPSTEAPGTTPRD